MTGRDMEKELDLSHIPDAYRGKICADLLPRVNADLTWNYDAFDPLNDYQRHLFALFLRASGIPRDAVISQIMDMSDDVSPKQKWSYALDVAHSSIVGFPRADGTLIPLPEQVIPI